MRSKVSPYSKLKTGNGLPFWALNGAVVPLPPTPPTFKPEDLPFQYLFYDDYTASGSSITQWTDKKGGTNATPPGNAPTVTDPNSAINNRVSLAFSSVNAQYLEFGSSPIFDKDEPFTFVSVVRLNNTGVAFRLLNAIVGADGFNASTALVPGDTATWGLWYVGFAGASAIPIARYSATANTNWAIYVAVYNGAGSNSGNWQQYLNGALMSSTTTPAGATTGSHVNRIGATSAAGSPGGYFQGDMAFSAGGRFALTSTQRTNLTTWLADYYDLPVSTMAASLQSPPPKRNYWAWAAAIAAGATALGYLLW